jgi:hypothetical protein
MNLAQIELAQRALLRHLVGAIDRDHFHRALDAVPSYTGGTPTTEDVSDLIESTASQRWPIDMRARIEALR